MARLGFLGLAMGFGCSCYCCCCCGRCKGSLMSKFSGSGYWLDSATAPNSTLDFVTSAAVERF